MDERKSSLSTKLIAEMVAFVALASALSYVKTFSLPQSGLGNGWFSGVYSLACIEKRS